MIYKKRDFSPVKVTFLMLIGGESGPKCVYDENTMLSIHRNIESGEID
jgi:hypothetical protein